MPKRKPPITEEELERLLAPWGIKPYIREDGTKWWRREDFEKAWKLIQEKDRSNVH